MNKLMISTVALALATSLAAGSALARGPWAANKGNTVGWQVMTPAERAEHQTKMRSFKTYDECKAYQQEHHTQMEARAKEKGVTLAPMGSGYGCDNMKSRGFLK
ncbi:hypothetical protein SCD_n03088 (plasmid) [Sulfuricella denitrificans skB26]|uniref:Uncharacterized protein n=1 Tax=Sulfuricella denitrificans (strain DSM 22764 / NBRC 105220 / skB26) TaxID=1163617 RepID=S6B990_SULDS|nr:hypothetical protein [Sulfuricella denitrificans]BAN36887.1 hypothetical protein SCD_n03088 [Sulfuricella denitrificans skB26]